MGNRLTMNLSMNGLIILHSQNITKSLQNLLARNTHFLLIKLKQQLCLLMKYIDDDIWVSPWVFLSIALWPTLNVVHFPRSAALLLRVGLMKMMKQTPTTKPATLKVHFVRSAGGGGGIPLESSSRACSRAVQASHHQMIYTCKGCCESFRIFWAKYCHKVPPMYLFSFFTRENFYESSLLDVEHILWWLPNHHIAKQNQANCLKRK